MGTVESDSSTSAPPVVSALDGDTIDVLHNQRPVRIRLNGIDCPEKGQAYGNNASTPLGPYGSPIGNQDQTCVLWVLAYRSSAHNRVPIL